MASRDKTLRDGKAARAEIGDLAELVGLLRERRLPIGADLLMAEVEHVGGHSAGEEQEHEDEKEDQKAASITWAHLSPRTAGVTSVTLRGYAAATARRSRSGRQELPVYEPGDRGDLLGVPGDHLATCLAAFGAEIDDPVGLLDHVEVVLDHQHRVPGVDEPLEHFEQLLDVGEMEPVVGSSRM